MRKEFVAIYCSEAVRRDMPAASKAGHMEKVGWVYALNGRCCCCGKPVRVVER